MTPDNSRDDNTQSFVALTKGTMVAHYRIAEKIGAGGMGEVYLAEDTDLKRHVALKFMPAHTASNADMRARFTREAQAAAKLDHPNIVPVYEVGEHQGRPFFAMAHIEGRPLREVIKQGKLSTDEAVRLTMQICEGLHEAHEAGVVHRDIKPGNIILDTKGRARLLDFGLAMVSGEDKLTKTGSTLGTVGYMSPEQVAGKQVDQRSDLFSVGVILYEMLTGRRPFEGDNDAAIVRAITNSEPEPVARFKSGVTGELQQIVDKALAKDPSLRYQHADGMLADLKRLSIESTSPKRTKFSLWIAAGIVIVVGGYFGYTGYISDGTDTEQPKKKMLAVLPFENLGAPEDEYFADGITDEITSRLARLSGLGVISRTSAVLYKDTDKGLPQIAEELGVDYILEGTIRWDKTGDTDRIRITPQLIQVSDNTHLWADNYERSMSTVFAVQSDIASNIASALNVKLRQSEQEAIDAVPTTNREAHNAYLAGMRLEDWDYPTELALQMFQRAVKLDPDFALGYAALSEAYTIRFYRGNRDEEKLKKALVAAERSLALHPGLPEAHFALGYYYYWGKFEYDRALEQFAIAEKDLPNDIRILRAVAFIWRRLGRLEETVDNLKRAYQLNPLDYRLPAEISETYGWMRRLDESHAYMDKALKLRSDVPWSHYWKANLFIWQGELEKARAALTEAPFDMDDLGLTWVRLETYSRDFTAAQNHLAVARRECKDVIPHATDFVVFHNLNGLLHRFIGTEDSAYAAFDSARVVLESRKEELGAIPGYSSAVGMALAGLGRHEEAIEHGKYDCEITPVSRYALNGARRLRDLAQIYVMSCKYKEAIDLLDSLSDMPLAGLTQATLMLNPMWDPLRDHPRFQALLEKYD